MNTTNIGWEDVPQDLIILLIERLSGIVSFIRVSATCNYRHSVFMANTNLCTGKIPWLMLAESETDNNDVHPQFYDISTNEIYDLYLPQVKGRKIAGSAYGWLVTAGLDSQFHLCNPLTGSQICLPPQPTFEVGPMLRTVHLSNGESRTEDFMFSPEFVRDSFISKATLSPNPTVDDYTVVVVHFGFGTFCLSYCRAGDKIWTRIYEGRGEIDFFDDGQREITSIKGQFYSVAINGAIYSCKITPEPKMEQIFDLYVRYPLDGWRHYIVECNGELLVVMRNLIDIDCCENPIPSILTREFLIYRIDMKAKTKIEIKNIGNYAFFLGHNNSVCVPITIGSALRRNSIYFVDEGYHLTWQRSHARGRDMGVFSLDDKSITPYYPGISVSNYSPPIWFSPTLL